MIDKRYKSNIYYWFKHDNSIIIKNRIMNRTYAICCAVYFTPGMLMIISLYIIYHKKFKLDLIFDPNVDILLSIAMFIIFITIVFITPIISLISLFWIPTKTIFDASNITYYPFSWLPLKKIIINYSDVKDVRFIEKKVVSGAAGICFTNIYRILILEIEDKSLSILTIKFSTVPSYYNQLKDEIKLQIKMYNE